MTEFTIHKQQLEEKKKALEEELGTIAKPSSENSTEWEAIQVDTVQEADPNDQADHLDEYQENRAVVDVLNAQYRDVLAALARIDEGTYGTCEVCGKDIEEERLTADPSAKTCMADMS